MEEVGLGDQIYEMMKARNLEEMKKALGRLQLMAQNVMIGTVQGDIYYLRNGRVPIRARASIRAVRCPATRRQTSGGGFIRCRTLSKSPTRPAAGCRTATAHPPP